MLEFTVICFPIPVGHYLSAFDGEIDAICMSLNQLTLHQGKFTNVVILSDSKATIQAISRTFSLLTRNTKLPEHCQASQTKWQNSCNSVDPSIFRDLWQWRGQHTSRKGSKNTASPSKTCAVLLHQEICEATFQGRICQGNKHENFPQTLENLYPGYTLRT